MWPNLTDDVQNYVMELLEEGGPPGTALAATTDDQWRPLFERWLTERGGINAYDCWAKAPVLEEEELATDYYFDDAPLRVDVEWPPNIAEQFAFIAQEMAKKANGEPNALDAPEFPRGRLTNDIYLYLNHIMEAWYTAFRADVDEVARHAEGQPGLAVDQLDFDYIDRVNGYSWQQAKDAGQVDFKFLSDPPVLLIGTANFQGGYPAALGDCDTGTIHVRSRGSTLGGPGLVDVEGSTDQDGFQAAFKRYSNKDVNFI